MSKPFSIAIDGPAGAGKSTLATDIARALGAKCMDTGAMYRAAGLHFLYMGLENDLAAVARLAPELDMALRFEGDEQLIFIDGVRVTRDLRSPEASGAASRFSAVPELRARLVKLQRELASSTSIVAEGRDICEVVLPNATLKLFVTASPLVRALRRYEQMRDKGEMPQFHRVLDEIVERDYNDSHREASPMLPARDAHVLDTSSMSREEALARVIELFESAIRG